MRRHKYIIDDQDGNTTFLGCGNEFFLGCGKVEKGVEGVDYITTHSPLPHSQALIALRIPGLKRAWQNAERVARQSEVMKQSWADGTIVPHVTTDAVRATRRRTAEETWERRRRGELPMPGARHNKAIGTRSRRCTVDGITIFHSTKHLIATLGAGKAGRKHPNFRFL